MKLHTFQLGCLLKANTLEGLSAKCLRDCVNYSGNLANEMKHLKTFTESACIERTIFYQLTRYSRPQEVIDFLIFNLKRLKEPSDFCKGYLQTLKKKK